MTRATGSSISALVAFALLLSGGRDGERTEGALRPIDGRAASAHAPTPRAARLGLRFEANAGQWDPRIRFVARSGGSAFLITDEGMTVELRRAVAPMPLSRSHGHEPYNPNHALAEVKTAAVTMKLAGARPSAPIGENILETKSHFFLGNDSSRWRSHVANYRRVRAKAVLPGVDMVWHEGQDGLEYDLEIASGFDARRVEIDFQGATGLTIANDGSLEIATTAGTLREDPPRVVQRGHVLNARYVLATRTSVRFALDGYDANENVLIDPVLASYSTYLGGAGNDFGFAIAVDATGNAYVTGTTASITFPTLSPFQAANAGADDAFVAKLNAAGTALVYATYLGGSGASGDVGNAIAVDSSGNAYVAGTTWSTDFPTHNPLQPTNSGGSSDEFVTKLNPAGSALVYSTYLGGTWNDWAGGIAIDPNGNAYVAGSTLSNDFPTHAAFSSTNQPGDTTAVVSKLDSSGSTLVYSTYLGGSNDDFATGIALDATGNAYVVGATSSTNFPLKLPIQAAFAGGQYDGFVSKLSSSGSALVYSTYLGGSGANESDLASGVAVDVSNSAYVTGFTNSTDFPTVNALQMNFAGGVDDGFVSKLDAAGSALVYSTFLGGSGSDEPQAIALDSSGNAYVSGPTDSTNFPTHEAFQPANAGARDIFVSKLSTNGSALVYSTYLGGTNNDQYSVSFPNFSGLAVDSTGSAYVTGETFSIDFPRVVPFQPVIAGGCDVFLTKLADPELANGAPCTVASACASDHCVDGFCCESDCTDACGACDVPLHLGACTPVTGAPHGSRPACPGTDGVCTMSSCDGKQSQTCTFPDASMVCDSVCTEGVETDSNCDGQGACVVGAAQSCNGLVCGDAAHCKTACSSNADCAAGFACAPDQTCKPGSVCLDDHTAGASDGTVRVCTPYNCNGSGTCNVSCKSVDDCVAPNVCDPSSHCVAEAPHRTSGCNAGSDDSAPGTFGTFMVAAALLAARARRRLGARSP